MMTPDHRSTLRLSRLLKRPVADQGGESIGRLADVIVRLRGTDYPLVSALVAAVGGREIFVPIDQVSTFDGDPVRLSSARLNLRPFERREGEVLLRADVLGHRLIDVANARLVRAADLELAQDGEEWVVAGVDTRRRPRRLPGRSASPPRTDDARAFRDWHDFESLIGHAGSALLRGPFARIRRLKPAQIADLLESASKEEETEILGRVHADPELEADVFEELDEDLATRLLGARTDQEIAGAGAVEAHQGQYLGALDRVRESASLQPEALTSVHAVDEEGVLRGVARLVTLVQADPGAAVIDVSDTDPVRVGADTDVTEVAVLMTDYNLITIPVVDDERRLLGVITVDDILEVALPEDWRRREAAQPPDARHGDPR